jgi:hypothetical protein
MGSCAGAASKGSARRRLRYARAGGSGGGAVRQWVGLNLEPVGSRFYIVLV